MLSLQQAIEIKESIISYLRATFTFRQQKVVQAFDRFIEEKMFKGPYVALKLPFVKATEEDRKQVHLDILPSWLPYDHQIKTWKRLSTQEQSPKPTLVTTGTGSGKTEAFLYPVLDYCYRQQHRPGIKALILYPMNALATDQAKRLAEAINTDERLKGIVTAGLFIGEGQGNGRKYPKTMGPDHIIEDRDTILDATPDIVLTNFKMLDYALMKQNYHRLWYHNLKDPELLQFLVLDELHTYDGAQGTDVANLIRRLKLKLNLMAGQLCPVGTSATIGNGPEAAQLLADYAQKIFGEVIDAQAVITENRVPIEKFFQPEEKLENFLPRPAKLNELEYREEEGLEDYLKVHSALWQLDDRRIGEELLRLKIVRDLLMVCNQGSGIKSVQAILRELTLINTDFKRLPQWDEHLKIHPQQKILESLLTLISVAREQGDTGLPFMYLQTQLWIRELSGVQYTLEETPEFTFRDEVEIGEETKTERAALPPWYCRECNSSGWLGVKSDNREEFSKDIREIYNKYFDNHKNVYFLLPGDTIDRGDLEVSGYQPDDFLSLNMDPVGLHILDKEEEGGMPIQAFRKIQNNRADHVCPYCNSRNTVAIIGTKIPTLSSIAISQTLATDLDQALSSDRKVLAFTNSVQDAAHQAGFVEARNYRFTFRASMQKVINTLSAPVRLPELLERFKAFWKEHSDETGTDKQSGYLYRFFPKDYIGKASPEDYQEGNTYAPHFLTEFDLRLSWELYSEFGFRSLIGRTLEKTGTSSVYFDAKRREAAWEEMHDWLSENDVSKSINREDWLRFTNLILHRSRSRGAVQHPYLQKFREERYRLWDLNWMRDSRHFFNPKYHPRSRLPKLLTQGPSHDGLLDSTYSKRTNWFHTYFIKSFAAASDLPDFINDFYTQWLQALVNVEVLDEVSSGNQETYALKPEVIWVEKNAYNYQCDTCDHIVYTKDLDGIEGGACLSYRCPGHYQLITRPPHNYYKAVYNRRRSPRVYAAEHTGLLVREAREELEYNFKNHPKFNSPNTLVATSTLEMGIDIGDLNTAYNNSVPPLPSNFLQRVGRAGRKSGDALLINFAKQQNHDLYYFTDPLEMMAGAVTTPGCYLEAKDILRRHFLAYCFDSWVSENPENHFIPNHIRDLNLEKGGLTNSEFFINRFNDFVDKNKVILTEKFLQQYGPKIRRETFLGIKTSLDNGHLTQRLFQVFEKLRNELVKLEEMRRRLDGEQKKSNLSKEDPKYKELDRAKRNLSGIKKSIRSRVVLEHLTNVGILPNYAFPETGVTLDAHVLTNRPEGATRPRMDKSFELVRSAALAIKEFAPENYFYTQGYRFEVTGVNTFDWSDKENYHLKRFCSRCDHMETASTAPKGNCPKCGDPSWNSDSNVHRFVKMTGVKSFSNEAKASLTDGNDDREFINYQLMNHINIDTQTSEGAWILKDIPFGIEYIHSAEITRVNYGRQEVMDSRRLKINDTEVMTKGFVTCRECGKSSSAVRDPNHKFHYGFCKHRGKRYENKKDEVFEEIYFFRSFQTEILKIVLPVQEFNTEAEISMFQAGIELGLKKYFKGNPDHIRILTHKEFNQKTQKFDRFLVLYDTIPGGTGYLQQLFDYKEFSQLLQLSYEAVRDCSCQYEGKDGCYKCIYSYSNQYHRKDLSRARAEKWFEAIVTRAENWESVPEGLTSLTDQGKIEESELEERFIKLLGIWANKTEGFHLETQKVDGIMNYYLGVDQGEIRAGYWITPQATLGPKDGVAYSTRPDFMILCERYEREGESCKEEVKKIAVYLDGYQYHASVTHNVFEKDIKIRQSIAKNPQYKTWTLTWKDMDDFESYIYDGYAADAIDHLFVSHFKAHHNKLLGTIRKGNKINYGISAFNMQRLIDQLIYPIIEVNENSWYLFLASWTKNLLSPSFPPDVLPALVKGELTDDDYLKTNKIKDLNGILAVYGLPVFGFVDWQIWINIHKKKIAHLLELKEANVLEKEAWENFWRLFNLFQSGDFLSEADFKKEDAKVGSAFLEEVKTLYDAVYHPFLEVMINKEILTPENIETTNSLLDEKGQVIAEAEFVLPGKKIAVDPFTEGDKRAFDRNHYMIFSLDQLKEIEL